MIEGPATWPTATEDKSSENGATNSERLRSQLQNAFADSYRIGQLIGSGACSTAFRATRVDSGDEVVLKVLELDPGADPLLVMQIMNECRVPQALSDTCAVVPSRCQQRESLVIIVMPFLPGGSARTMLASGAPTPLGRVQEIVSGVASTLQCLHRQGTVHLGLTPENILFDARGRPNLTDVGITNIMAKAPRARGARSFRASAYAAPEQRRSQKVDGRADQYALAMIAYELLTGHTRMNEETVQGIATVDPIEIPSDVPLRPGYPLYVNTALRRALSVVPDNRYPTAVEFADALAGRSRHAAKAVQATRAPLVLSRRILLTGVFAALVAVGAILIATSAPARDAVSGAWTSVSERVSSPGKNEVGVDSSLTPAPVVVKNTPPAKASPPSTPTATVATRRAKTTQPAPATKAAPIVAAAAPDTAPKGAVETRSSAGSLQSASLPSAPNADTTPSGGASMWSNARSWIAEKFGQSSTPLVSSRTGYIHVSVDKGASVVLVDGVPRGSAPLTIPVEPGRHVVAVTGPLKYSASPTEVIASAQEIASVSFHSVGRAQ